MNIFRAVLITGPPGIGKTTSAHLLAKLEGFTPIELNASDARSKKLVEVCYVLHEQRDQRLEVFFRIARIFKTHRLTDGWVAVRYVTPVRLLKVT